MNPAISTTSSAMQIFTTVRLRKETTLYFASRKREAETSYCASSCVEAHGSPL